ncbi:hypothetical protein DWW31_09765 [Clostridium sp. AF15-17LB]|nr:hypothetical protein DWW31_09765 [Clostridium sp. AF15-17LB]
MPEGQVSIILIPGCFITSDLLECNRLFNQNHHIEIFSGTEGAFQLVLRAVKAYNESNILKT